MDERIFQRGCNYVCFIESQQREPVGHCDTCCPDVETQRDECNQAHLEGDE